MEQTPLHTFLWPTTYLTLAHIARWVGYNIERHVCETPNVENGRANGDQRHFLTLPLTTRKPKPSTITTYAAKLRSTLHRCSRPVRPVDVAVVPLLQVNMTYAGKMVGSTTAVMHDRRYSDKTHTYLHII